MRTIFRFSFVLFLLYTLAGCSSNADLKVVKLNFEQEIEQQQNLVFTFNKDICPDSLLGKWDTIPYINITPRVAGKFKWTQSSELLFSPAEGFAPATEYTATLQKEVVSHSKTKYSYSTEAIRFHTAPLRIENINITWTRNSAMTKVVQLNLTTNYDINLTDAATKIKLINRTDKVPVSFANSGTGKVISLQFQMPRDPHGEEPLKIILPKGIPIAGTKIISNRDTTIMATVPSAYTLTITGITATHSGIEGVLNINTSQPILGSDIKSKIAIDPPITFEAALTDNGITVNSTFFNPSTVYTIAIDGSVEGIFGGKMEETYKQNISFKKPKPTITFNNTNGLYLSSACYKNVAIDIVNVPEIEITVYKIFENNIEQFMNRGSRYEYKYDEEEGESSEYRYYDTHEFGSEVYKDTIKTATLPKQGNTRLLRLNIKDKLKSYNGIYVVQVASTSQNWVQESKILCLSDIGLIVKQEKDNIYVFANSLSKAQPMAGLPITFISSNNQKMTTLNTNSEGVAVYSNIAKQMPGFQVGMITAKQGEDYTMLLLEKHSIALSRFDVGGHSPAPNNLNAMIYAERNLYRPGETLHISTIVRQNNRQLPGEMPVTMKLVKPDGNELAAQRKILNAQGSAEFSFPTVPQAATGSYTASLYTADNVLLNTYMVSIEEF
ncbi:MAG: hypothetical protein EBX41_07000, partial [Chitinophagia bacterium]|nr:hypothetical protein [Chitinophagia bacterium]